MKPKQAKAKVEIAPLFLYVWEQFAPDYSSGLAVAIARSETDAQDQITRKLGYKITDWGVLSVYDFKHRRAFAVTGGG